jgi:hypothetical protein
MTGSHLTAKPSDDPAETMDQSVEIKHCDTLDQFWNLVSPIGEYFDRPPTKFVFRGQGNSQWKLVPKVFRTECLKKYKRGIASHHRDHPGHFFFEWHLLYSFMEYCDARGLVIPNDSMDFREYFCQDNITTRHGKKDSFLARRTGFAADGFSSASRASDQTTGLVKQSIRCVLPCCGYSR